MDNGSSDHTSYARMKPKIDPKMAATIDWFCLSDICYLHDLKILSKWADF